MNFFLHAPRILPGVPINPPLIHTPVLAVELTEENSPEMKQLPEQMYRLTAVLHASPDAAISLLMSETELKQLAEELQKHLRIVIASTVPKEAN